MKPRPMGSSKTPSAETNVYSITFRTLLLLQVGSAGHRRLARVSTKGDPNWPGNWAAANRPVCVLSGVYTDGLLVKHRKGRIDQDLFPRRGPMIYGTRSSGPLWGAAFGS